MNFTTTLQDYLYEVKRKLHITVTEDNTEWSNSFLIDSINDAREWFWGKAGYVMRDGRVRVTSVVDQEEYALAGLGIKRIKKIRFNDGTQATPLTYFPLQDYLALTITAESGDPIAWSIEKSTLKLYPKPSSAVTNGIEIFCDKVLNRLSDSDTDSDYSDETDSDIETSYRPIIVRYVLGLCWLEAEQESKANINFAMAEKLFDDNAFEINSETTGENIPRSEGILIDETDERHYSRPIG